MSAGRFKAGDVVRYVPNHADGNAAHPDCEDGVVTSRNEHTVFVRFGAELHSKGCYPDTLIHTQICSCSAEDMPFGRCCKAITKATQP